MDANRAKERPLEYHGPNGPAPESVKDWHSDRLATAILSLENRLKETIAERHGKGLGNDNDDEKAAKGLENLRKAAASPSDRAELANLLEKEVQNQGGASQYGIMASPSGAYAEKLQAAGGPLALAAFQASVSAHAVSYYGLNSETCQKGSTLELACNRAHALVSKGYIDGADLDKLEVAMLDKESARERAGHALHQISSAAGLPFYIDEPTNDGSSVFNQDTHRVTVSKQQSHAMLPSREASSATTAVFSHELGHFLTKDKLLEVVDKGVQAIENQGGPDAVLARRFIDVPEKYLKGEQRQPEKFNDQTGESGLIGRHIGEGGNGATWVGAASEMYGDCLAIAAVKAEHGNEAALTLAHEFGARRDQHHQEYLTAAQGVANGAKNIDVPFYGATHHTTAAVDQFIGAIKDGRLDAVKTPGQLDALIGEAVAKGLIAEYSQVRGAELNLWQVKDGVAVPGLPEGISKESLLIAELKTNLNRDPGHPKLIVPAEMLDRLPDDAKVSKLNVRDNEGNFQTLNISNVPPSGIVMPENASKLQNSGIEGLKKDVAQNEAEHVKELGRDPGKPSVLGGGDTLPQEPGQQLPTRAESPAPEPQAAMAM